MFLPAHDTNKEPRFLNWPLPTQPRNPLHPSPAVPGLSIAHHPPPFASFTEHPELSSFKTTLRLNRQKPDDEPAGCLEGNKLPCPETTNTKTKSWHQTRNLRQCQIISLQADDGTNLSKQHLYSCRPPANPTPPKLQPKPGIGLGHCALP
jgi:hypothetical protein